MATIDIGSIYGSVVLEDKFSSKAKNVQNESEKTEKNIDDLSSSVDTLSAAFAALGVGAIAKSFVSIGAQMSTLAAQAEKTEVVFTSLLGGSSQRAKELTDELNKLSLSSPFQATDIQDSAKTLLSFGASADTVTDSLKMIGDVAAGTGKDINDLAVIYGQSLATGLVQGVDLKQFVNAGVPILKILAKNLNVAEKEIFSLASAGKITSKDMTEAFKSMSSEGGMFFDLMSKQSETFSGALGKMKNTTDTLFASIGKTLNSLLRPAIIAINFAIEKLLDLWQSIPESVQMGIIAFTAIALAAGTVAVALPLLPPLIASVSSAFTAAFVTNPIGLIILGVAGAIAALIAVAVKMYKEFDKFEKFLTPVTKSFNVLKKTLESIDDYLADSSIVKGFKNLVDSFNNSSSDIDLFATAIKAALTPSILILTVFIGSIQVLTKVFDGFIKIAKQFVDSLYIIRDAFIALKEGRFGEFIESDAVEHAKRAFESIADATKVAFVDVKNEIKKTADNVKITLNDIVTEHSKSKEKIENNQIEFKPKLDTSGIQSGKTAGAIAIVGDDMSMRLSKAFSEGMTTGFLQVGKEFGAGGEVYDAFLSSAKEIGEGLEKIFDAAVDNLMARFAAMQASIEQTIKKVDFFSEVSLNIEKKRNAKALKDLEDSENQKIDAIRQAHISKMELLDIEFAARKRALDIEFEQEIAAERARFELRLAEMQQKSADEEQARLATSVMNADWDAYVEMMRQQHNENLLNIDSDANAVRQFEKSESDAAIELAEQEKNDKLAKMQEEQNAREEKMKKESLLIRTLLEYQAFQLDKEQKKIQAKINLAQTLASAVQAGAMVAATIPLLGIVMGPILTASLSALALSTYATTMGMIQSAQYIPPAALFAREGGVIHGPAHANGGVLVNAEGGEAVLSRELTSDLASYIDDRSDRQLVISFGTGAIVVNGNIDNNMIDKLSERIAQKIQQRRF